MGGWFRQILLCGTGTCLLEAASGMTGEQVGPLPARTAKTIEAIARHSASGNSSTARWRGRRRGTSRPSRSQLRATANASWWRERRE